MMMIEEAIVSFFGQLDDFAGVKVYGARRPQGPRPLPEILFSRITTLRRETYCGQDGFVNVEFQFDVFGAGKTSAITLGKQLRQTLRNFRGTMGDVPVGPVFLTNEGETADVEPGTYRVTHTFNIWYQED